MLRVGISEVNITPELGKRMVGMLNPPKAQGVQWPLMGRTFVFDDGNERVALVCLDLALLMTPFVSELRTAVAQGTDVPPENILFSCSHTHRGPHTFSVMNEDADWEYLDWLQERLREGLAQALAMRQPARLKIGQVDAPGWTFNRRPVYRTNMGEEVGTQGPLYVSNFLRLEGPSDSLLQGLLVSDLQGKPMGGIVHYTCHPTVMGGVPVYSADYCGALTETLAQRHGGIYGFMQGCAGNMWCIDRSKDRAFVEMGQTHASKMGTALADKFDEALAAGVSLGEAPVRTAKKMIKIPQRRPTREQVDLARWYLEQAKPDVDQDAFTRKIYGHAYTFYGNSHVVTDWFCRELIGVWEWQRRVGTRELCEDVEVQVLALGDLALVGLPAEYFNEFGLRIKGESPFKQTFVGELCNGYASYIGTQEAFTHGGYETRLGGVSRLVPEAGDMMADTAVELLKGIV